MTTPQAYPEWVQTGSEKKLFDDFRYFLWFIWKHLELPDPTALQYDIALYVSNPMTGRSSKSAKGRRVMVQAFRGAAKTWITCAYALWRLYRNPQERIKIVSANEEKANENATFIRRLIEEIELLRFLRPRPASHDRDSTLKFDVAPARASATPSVSCVGITGQLTGGRATILISDDVEVPKNSLTETQREMLAKLVKEYDALVVPEGFDIIYLGTPQTEQSIYRELPKRGYDVRIWPARYPTQKQREQYGPYLAPSIRNAVDARPSLIGHSTEPTRFSDLDLAEREASYGSEFALQFMLDTSLADAERYPLRTSDLICLDVDKELVPGKLVWSADKRYEVEGIENIGFNGDRLYRPMFVADTMLPIQERLMVVDPSGRGKNETSYCVIYHMQGMLFLKKVGGFKDGYGDATLEGLATIAKEHKVNEVLCESNMGDGMFQALLAPWLAKVYPCTITEVRASAMKERRIIEDLEPVLNQHRLAIDTATAKEDIKDGQNSFLYQLTHITKDRGALKQDDRVDCVSHGVRYFRSRLQQDAQSAEEAHLAKLREQQQREFEATYYGRHPPKRLGFTMTNRGLKR